MTYDEFKLYVNGLQGEELEKGKKQLEKIEPQVELVDALPEGKVKTIQTAILEKLLSWRIGTGVKRGNYGQNIKTAFPVQVIGTERYTKIWTVFSDKPEDLEVENLQEILTRKGVTVLAGKDQFMPSNHNLKNPKSTYFGSVVTKGNKVTLLKIVTE
jgi:hypothetical protein